MFILKCIIIYFQEFIVLSSEFVNSVQNHIDKCESETQPPPNTFGKIIQGNVESEASLKFAHCYLTEAGFLNKDGHINPDKIISAVKNDRHNEEIRNAFGECNKINGGDHLDNLRLLFACYKEKSPIIFKL